MCCVSRNVTGRRRGILEPVLPATPPAVAKSLRILAIHRTLFGGKTRTMAEADIARVVQIFEAHGAKWVLVGAHAVGLLIEPRATADFDFIIEDRKLKPVVSALRDAFGELDEEDIGAAVRLRAIDVDLIRATHPLFKQALVHSRRIGDWNVPIPEVIIVLKFLSATSPWRGPEKRTYDMGDVRGIYRSIGRADLDMDLMMKLAGMVYPRADEELGALLDRLDRGEPIEV